MPRSELVSTGVAAQAIGVSRATLARWWANGLVKPELVTAGGQARWNVETLKADLRRLAQTEED
ncbi:MAG: MerR family transcriptional regulator [Saccharothrix sp.]|nr:MerR family transcriptional regulator [Saccharothrix sp.]